ncbi:MAG: fumarylacetoacetate hydrolase family protein [Phycisphaerales bacterium JB063]
MRIQRVLDSQQQTRLAACHEDGSLTELEGDLLGTLTDTGRSLTASKVLAPIDPAAILCIGLNYRKHAEEGGFPIPERPIVFSKGTNTLQHPGDPILLPTHAGSEQVDYECELAVVIGRPCKNVSPDQALSYVLGYTAANDVSSRDWQFEWGGGQWVRSKMFDTFCPLGPTLVTPESISDPNKLKISTTLNGQTMQDWTTADMIFDVPSIISFLSQSTTLIPGTVILTGTPHGVGMGQTPPRWLRAGDSVTVELEGVGELTNPVVREH